MRIHVEVWLEKGDGSRHVGSLDFATVLPGPVSPEEISDLVGPETGQLARELFEHRPHGLEAVVGYLSPQLDRWN